MTWLKRRKEYRWIWSLNTLSIAKVAKSRWVSTVQAQGSNRRASREIMFLHPKNTCPSKRIEILTPTNTKGKGLRYEKSSEISRLFKTLKSSWAYNFSKILSWGKVGVSPILKSSWAYNFSKILSWGKEAACSSCYPKVTHYRSDM